MGIFTLNFQNEEERSENTDKAGKKPDKLLIVR